mmetsp:Transcript_56491/g.151096  ORF Transcript_56491/g.151096 Transcript_56491/m.151096 type:complete len:141 (-) Transcript_56491:135-557(-)
MVDEANDVSAVEVSSLEVSPSGECPCEESLMLKIRFTAGSHFAQHRWVVSYIADTARKRVVVALGETSPVDVAVGDHVMEFSAPGFDTTAVRADVLQQQSGLLSATFTSPVGDEVLRVNMVVRMRLEGGCLFRTILNPME